MQSKRLGEAEFCRLEQLLNLMGPLLMALGGRATSPPAGWIVQDDAPRAVIGMPTGLCPVCAPGAEDEEASDLESGRPALDFASCTALAVCATAFVAAAKASARARTSAAATEA
mmetsp:Transcript_58447/g.103922  ORF Transcript_58447/g.103922 Transcript_58447/m.103922 type:complete len:114 (-) Transcript_58447:32-373(-)